METIFSLIKTPWFLWLFYYEREEATYRSQYCFGTRKLSAVPCSNSHYDSFDMCELTIFRLKRKTELINIINVLWCILSNNVSISDSQESTISSLSPFTYSMPDLKSIKLPSRFDSHSLSRKRFPERHFSRITKSRKLFTRMTRPRKLLSQKMDLPDCVVSPKMINPKNYFPQKWSSHFPKNVYVFYKKLNVRSYQVEH